jgi:hypothetical protein
MIMASQQYDEGDRVELTEDWGASRPAFKKGHKGTVDNFPFDKEAAKRFCFVKFDLYDVVMVSYDKIKKI